MRAAEDRDGTPRHTGPCMPCSEGRARQGDPHTDHSLSSREQRGGGHTGARGGRSLSHRAHTSQLTVVFRGNRAPSINTKLIHSKFQVQSEPRTSLCTPLSLSPTSGAARLRRRPRLRGHLGSSSQDAPGWVPFSPSRHRRGLEAPKVTRAGVC